MVGVPGKYKGCETCRRRRVKCSNERPFCQKCLSSGRECEGYSRDRVFITGTPANKGRVASHPKKCTQSRRQDNRSSTEPQTKLDVSLTQPLTSAWNDHTSLSANGIQHSVLVTALPTKLDNLMRSGEHEELDKSNFRLDSLPYVPADFHPATEYGDVDTSAYCILGLADADDAEDHGGENFCAFLYEQNAGTATPSSRVSDWAPTEEQIGLVRKSGPAHFSSFPNHFFFVRIYRPTVVSLALLSRRQTFLAEYQWTTKPWQYHPKSAFDNLLDLMLDLPSIFVRADEIFLAAPTLTRRTNAQNLLLNCLALETQFEGWLGTLSKYDSFQSMPYWSEEIVSPGSALPFSNLYVFKDGHTGLMFLYYWMSQILFNRCVEGLYHAIFQPVIDAYPNVWPNLPPNMQIDPSRYQNGRELAANICRGLDFVLNNTVQPDLVLAPMAVALNFFKEMNPDGVLEIMWLESFKARVTSSGQHMANKLQSQRWVEVSKF